jgi:hypothetical protein
MLQGRITQGKYWRVYNRAVSLDGVLSKEGIPKSRELKRQGRFVLG